LIHSGDLTGSGRIEGLRPVMQWLYGLPHPNKVIIAGNHDFTLDQEWSERHDYIFKNGDTDNLQDAQELMNGENAKAANITYLEYDITEVQVKPGGRKWKIYGSPGSAAFCGMAFNYDRGEEAKKLCAAIPEDTDILITHGPPYSVLDRVQFGAKVGCEVLQERINAIKPKLHVFGHIHEDRGVQISNWSAGEDATVFVNAANMPSGEKWATERRASGRARTDLLPPIIVDLFDPATEGD